MAGRLMRLPRFWGFRQVFSLGRGARGLPGDSTHGQGLSKADRPDTVLLRVSAEPGSWSAANGRSGTQWGIGCVCSLVASPMTIE